MNYLRIPILAVVAFLAVGVLPSQEIGYLDLTDLHPRQRIRGTHGLGGGSCGGGGGYEPKFSVALSLTYLDNSNYSLGDDLSYEMKVQNTGKTPIDIPWTPHLGDLEPADPSETYSYLHATFVLNFTEPTSKQRFSLDSNSYGSSNVPGSIRTLLPGNVILVRGRHQIDHDDEWLHKQIAESSPAHLKVSAYLMLDQATYTPGKNNDDGTEQAPCIPLNITRGAALDVALFPPKSK